MGLTYNTFLLIAFAGCLERTSTKEIMNIEEIIRDTAYVAIDSSSINKNENTFDMVLLYKHDGKAIEIYRINNRDYSIEFKYNFTYSEKKNDYLCYTIDDLPTGLRWDILFNNKTKVFYKTEPYDKKALGDELIKETIDFEHETVSVKSIEAPTYTIKLTKIWGGK
jgi:hypothetical protein